MRIALHHAKCIGERLNVRSRTVNRLAIAHGRQNVQARCVGIGEPTAEVRKETRLVGLHKDIEPVQAGILQLTGRNRNATLRLVLK